MYKYKVAYATGSRADYGIVKNYLKLLNNDNEVNFSILVTGTHLEEKYGYSLDIIKSDGFQIEYEAPLNIQNNNNANVIHSMAVALESFGNYFEYHKYDLLIILGDRYEMLSVATAAAMQKIPILHLHGGEVTYGNYDEFIRHSITKMSNYHFTSTDVYRKRVIQLGENPNNAYYLGSLGAENCCKIDKKKIKKEIFSFSLKKYWVVSFHPETLTKINIENQIHEIISVLENVEKSIDIIFIGTNADTESEKISYAWKDFVNRHKNAHYFENLNVDSFLYLVKNSIALIGNSSSGIIEAPSLGVYSINIGDRQKGRLHGNSVIDIECNRFQLSKAMENISSLIAVNNEFSNPYYMKDAAKKYYKKTKEILTHKLAHKKDVVKIFYDI